jgi:hypothetical protein
VWLRDKKCSGENLIRSEWALHKKSHMPWRG